MPDCSTNPAPARPSQYKDDDRAGHVSNVLDKAGACPGLAGQIQNKPWPRRVSTRPTAPAAAAPARRSQYKP